MVPIPFLKANILVDRMELFSNHQSSLDLSICSNILHKEEEMAIGRKEVLEFCLGIEMTLYEFHNRGICRLLKI